MRKELPSRHDPSPASVFQQRLEQWRIRSCPLLIAVSGGSDSTALLLAALEAAAPLDVTVTAVHLDHALRDHSASDARWLEKLCDRYGIPLLTERCHVRTRSQASGLGLEETARLARREFFISAALSTGANWVALAHTADDQVETVLHHLLRGSGLEGLSGMEEVSPLTETVHLLRPFLTLTRNQLTNWLTTRQQDWREDETNADLSLTRNRIRHELLPRLREQFNPRVDEALLRLAEQCRDVQSVMAHFAEKYLAESLLSSAPHSVRMDLTLLADLPMHLRREVGVRLWKNQSWPLKNMGFDHWQSLASMMGNQSASSQEAHSFPGGIAARRTGALLHMTRSETPPKKP